ncbi:putative cysteine-rich repeat secretory protein 5 [Raphanus sativus]|nr:putative cysteine-rich repeat secretory protein 5 [Raphanus sativus]
MTRIVITNFAIVLFCIFLFSLQTISQSAQMSSGCDQVPDNFNKSSFSQSNLENVLSTLRDLSSHGSYGNATAGTLSPNIVYGMFLCRGDISRASCSNCVHSATLSMAETCNSHKGTFVFYNECMVRYSNFSFFTLVEDEPVFGRFSEFSSSIYPKVSNQTISGKINELIPRASSSSPVPYFVEDQEHVTQVESSYDLKATVQCSPDLDPRNCTVCLRLAAQFL